MQARSLSNYSNRAILHAIFRRELRLHPINLAVFRGSREVRRSAWDSFWAFIERRSPDPYRCIAVADAEAENIHHRSQFQFANWKSCGSNFVGYQRRASKRQWHPRPLLFLRLIECTSAASGGLEQQEQQEQQGPRD